jgi:hypothetical protein
MKLSKRIVLHLSVSLYLVLQGNDLVCPLVCFAQRKEADYPDGD